MNFDAAVILAILLSLALHWNGKVPQISNSWLTHVSSVEQACAAGNDSTCTLPRQSRWARR